MSLRLQKILDRIKEEKLDAILLNHTPNVSYAAGFFAPDSYLIASAKGLTVITDSRYTHDFLNQAPPGVRVVELKDNIFATICAVLAKKRLRHVGFESRHMSFAECQKLHELSKKKISWIPLKETIEPIRQIKENKEIAAIRSALRITEKAYDFIEKRLKPGVTELRIAAELERFIRLQGATSSAFDIIVASGPNSSYPHASISQRAMQKGDPVLIDMGVTLDGYKCDLTRTFFLGTIKPVVRRVAAIVKEAQRHAIKAIKPGVPLKDVDAAARNYISSKGFGENFGHALGHGIGLEVHEAPSVNKKNDLPLRTGMVLTIEPGIYVAGSFGIRIEDMVLVTNNGVEVLSGNDQQ